MEPSGRRAAGQNHGITGSLSRGRMHHQGAPIDVVLLLRLLLLQGLLLLLLLPLWAVWARAESGPGVWWPRSRLCGACDDPAQHREAALQRRALPAKPALALRGYPMKRQTHGCRFRGPAALA